MEDKNNSYILLSGLETSKKLKEEIAEEVLSMKAQGKRAPHLAAVLVGNDGGSITYVNAKVKACEKVGFESTLIRYDDNVSQEELLRKIAELNNDPKIDGFIVQLPLPKHINEREITLAISPLKDVDGFHPENLGKMALNLPAFISATPNGILSLLEHYKINTEGKHCVILGRSSIVGMPASILMARNATPGNSTVTLTHSKTKNLKDHCLRADILIVAIGKAEFVTSDMVKKGAVVIDVGMSRVPDSSKKSGYKLYGDVKFDEVAPKCSYITPVPGGVGPMTIVSLLKNTLQAAKSKITKR